LSKPPSGGTYKVSLNPDGFPQENGILAANWNSDLATKPSCQLEASYKVSQGFLSLYPEQAQSIIPLPYKSTKAPEAWLTAHLQAYIYFQYLVNIEIDKVLADLEKNGLLANTIVTFTSDHGEVGGAHGGQIEKWNNAYRETIHVPFIVSSPLVNADADKMREISQVTSHIDLVPTLLGLAGYDQAAQAQIEQLILGHEVYPLVGRDLSTLIYGQEPGDLYDAKAGVLFVTDDEITLPTDKSNLPAAFVSYLKIVNAAIAAGQQATTPGPITQPNHIQAYVESEWKLARYWDPNGVAKDQWELYYTKGDPEENINLLSWSMGLPVLEPTRMPSSWGLSAADLVAALESLRVKLDESLKNAGYSQGNTGSTQTTPKKPSFSQHHFNIP
jgi:arylsulfatase A-like enzyme